MPEVSKAKINKEMLYRSLSVTESEVNEETRTIRFPVASDKPVEVGASFFEVLSHAPGALRMGQRQTSMSLLFNHDRDHLLGVVEGLDQDAHRTYATVRFAKTDEGERAFQLVKDRILVNVSCGYRVFSCDQSERGDQFVATDWEIFEVSLVTIPADPSVGVYRSFTLNSEVNNMPNNQDTAGKTGAGVDKARDLDVSNIREQERTRIQGIEAMCRDFNIPMEQRNAFINDGKSVDQVRALVMDIIRSRGQNPVGDATRSKKDDFNLGLSDRERSQYSVIRALNAAVTGDWRQAGFERELSDELARRMQRDSSGFYMPTNISYTTSQREYLVGTDTKGGNLVATNLMANSFIEALRAKAMVLRLGATMMSGLVGNVAISRQTGTSQTKWLTEEKATLESTGATFDQVSLSMKTIAAKSFISRNMLRQSSIDIENFVRMELIKSIALGVDLAALSGSGSEGQPKGIFNQDKVLTVGNSNGTSISFDLLIDMETKVAEKNADAESMAYLCNASTIGALKKLKNEKGEYIWRDIANGFKNGIPGEANGYPVARSNQCRSNIKVDPGSGEVDSSEMFFGNWSDVIIGEWGVLEILPNPYSSNAYDNGGIEIRALQSIDIAVRRPESFCVCKNLLLA